MDMYLYSILSIIPSSFLLTFDSSFYHFCLKSFL